MGFNNVNVNVSGPVQPISTYKTIVLKGNQDFASQIYGKTNHKFVIKYDFDLGLESVTIPEGCLLDFDGGSISNGALVGQNTILIYYQGLDDIFHNVTRSGSFIYNNTLSADEEDLTEEGNLVKLKDRDTTDGMGKIILRKNKTFAEQLTQENTIYEIRYDFDLGGDEVTIPSNCVLQFEGGSISNGTLTGQETAVIAEPVKIFNTDITVSGTWNIKEAYPEWFGAEGDGVTDDSDAFYKCANWGVYMVALNDYKITRTIFVRTIIDGKKVGRVFADIPTNDFTSQDNARDSCAFRGRNNSDNLPSELRNLMVYGSGYNPSTGTVDKDSCRNGGVFTTIRMIISGCKFQGFEYGIVVPTYGIFIESSEISNNLVNIGISSSQLHSGAAYYQTNAVLIFKCRCQMGLSGIGLRIGGNPWADTPGDLTYGHLIEIRDSSFDYGSVWVGNIQGVVFDGCYFENANKDKDSGNKISLPYDNPYGFDDMPTDYTTGVYLYGGLADVNIVNCWFHKMDYGIKCDVIPNNIHNVTIKNNTFATINQTNTYFARKPDEILIENNKYSATADYRINHIGLYGTDVSILNKAIKDIYEQPNVDSSNLIYWKNKIYNTDNNTRICNANYLTYTSTVSINGHYETVNGLLYFICDSASDLTSVFCGYALRDYDALVLRVVIEKKALRIYSPTDDLPDGTETKIYFKILSYKTFVFDTPVPPVSVNYLDKYLSAVYSNGGTLNDTELAAVKTFFDTASDLGDYLQIYAFVGDVKAACIPLVDNMHDYAPLRLMKNVAQLSDMFHLDANNRIDGATGNVSDALIASFTPLDIQTFTGETDRFSWGGALGGSYVDAQEVFGVRVGSDYFGWRVGSGTDYKIENFTSTNTANVSPTMSNDKWLNVFTRAVQDTSLGVYKYDIATQASTTGTSGSINNIEIKDSFKYLPFAVGAWNRENTINGYPLLDMYLKAFFVGKQSCRGVPLIKLIHDLGRDN